ncbi:exosome complex component RRP45-like [Panulirus ornatus]|uniref:exosome complex component RRP45-like n=1 Tax=Panulirus ornatus TaxID=150431 RepID=UPI003A8AB95C
MKEVPLSTCERTSIVSAIQAGFRFDNRKFLEVRDISLNFGKDYGCCTVTLGQTRVLAQVTCEVVEPRPSRPHEGKISISVHLSPMAAPHFEPGRGNDLVDELQQILDRNIKESRCLDLESLCIMAEESVWQLRVDVTVLNHAGNLGDACNLASVAALRHFHRPDVTVEEDGRVTVHTLEEREPIPTFMKKVPVCLTYAFFVVDEKCYMLMDPSEKEERVMSGKLVVGLNPHGEITSLVFPGRVSLQREDIMNCIRNAFSKAKASAEMVQKAVEEDLEKRKSMVKPEGFTNCLISDAIYTRKRITKNIQTLNDMEFKIPQESVEIHQEFMNEASIEGVMLDCEEEMLDCEEEIDVSTTSKQINQQVTEAEVGSDSEEEVAEKLTSQDLL